MVLALELLGMAVLVILIFVALGLFYRAMWRQWKVRNRYLQGRVDAARDNARRVHEEQERLREQRRQQHP